MVWGQGKGAEFYTQFNKLSNQKIQRFATKRRQPALRCEDPTQRASGPRLLLTSGSLRRRIALHHSLAAAANRGPTPARSAVRRRPRRACGPCRGLERQARRQAFSQARAPHASQHAAPPLAPLGAA